MTGQRHERIVEEIDSRDAPQCTQVYVAAGHIVSDSDRSTHSDFLPYSLAYLPLAQLCSASAYIISGYKMRRLIGSAPSLEKGCLTRKAFSENQVILVRSPPGGSVNGFALARVYISFNRAHHCIKDVSH